MEAPAGRFAFVYFWILFAAMFTLARRFKTQLPARGLWPRALYSWHVPLHICSSLFWAFRASFDRACFSLLGFAVALDQRHELGPCQEAHFCWLAALCLILGFFQIGDRVLAHVLRHPD